MNKAFFIGNTTRDVELRTTPNGIAVATFNVAVNGRKKDDETLFVRVTAWRGLAENCARYLSKGKKVAVVGPVSLNTYTAQDGSTRSSLEVTAEDVEFLSPRADTVHTDDAPSYSKQNFTPINTDDDGETLPF